MAISVDWITKIITVPKADLTLISGTLYEHDTEAFRDELKNLEAGEAGIAFLDTHRHATEVTVAGVTYARVIEIINGYSIEYEEGSYSVRLVGSNNNIFDVENGILVQNSVQVIPGNSAGLIVKTVGSGLSETEQAKLDELWRLQGLDATKPMTVTPTSRVAGDIDLAVSGDGETSTTVARQ